MAGLCDLYGIFSEDRHGPILLHGEFIPQLGESSRHIPRGENLAKGLMVLSAGLFKKVILAEFFAAPVTWGFSQVAALSATDAFMVMAAYTFQLYFDFSGYCDMAMGVSQMFNIVLPGNFDSLIRRCRLWSSGNAGT